ncbi:MAG TPA: hypothetical protein PKY86_01260 [Niabella sp.]|nr:hypothetical protein [Niabella sp.]HQW15539.1 hypothetical protein [Niabella sp.]HQX20682.1 hypothetical protein [Niabella sp.]HQX42513.1 hypothetical protein [Niabella sp.]HRB07086.1 hypothetical protein [Niabella sp.]
MNGNEISIKELRANVVGSPKIIITPHELDYRKIYIPTQIITS